MSSMQIGVDLAKTVFEVAVSNRPGRVDERRRRTRARLGAFVAAQPRAQIVMEACGSGHHWGRELQRLGHTVALLHPGDVARYRDGNQTDRADATALLEAARNAITKRGNSYLRMLLVHGVRSALRAGHVARDPDDLRHWARAVEQRKGHNVAAVALANKLARVCWRVWYDQRPFARREAQ